MKKLTMVALGCGAGAVACIALAVHFKKRKQTGGAVACGVVGGCAAAVAAGAVCTLRKRDALRLEERKTPLLTRMGEMVHDPVDQSLFHNETLDMRTENSSMDTDDSIQKVQRSIEKFSGHKYIIADTSIGQQEFRCDNFVEAVLNDAGYNFHDYMAGTATEKNVQNHIENALAKRKTLKNARFDAPHLANGAYVVYMNESAKGYEPHAGIIVIENESIVYTDNSSGNANKGVNSTKYNSIQDFQRDYGYSSFYYQKIE